MCIISSNALKKHHPAMVWQQQIAEMPPVLDDPQQREVFNQYFDYFQHLHGTLVTTSHPNILCTVLPDHHRSNKSLRSAFKVIVLDDNVENAIVTIYAGNDENPCAEIKNCEAKIQNQVASFSDIRFIGRSGRGKTFTLSIVVRTSTDVLSATYQKAIKVTVDGPREPRSKNTFSCYPGPPLLFGYSQWLDQAAYASVVAGEFVANQVMAFGNHQATPSPQFGLANGYSQYPFAAIAGNLPPLYPGLHELRLPIPPMPTMVGRTPMLPLGKFSSPTSLPLGKSSPSSTMTSDENSDLDERGIHSSDSIKSAFQQVRSASSNKRPTCTPPSTFLHLSSCSPPLQKRARTDSSSPVDLRSASKPKVWRPYTPK